MRAKTMVLRGAVGPMHPALAASSLLFLLAGFSAWLTHVVACAEAQLWGYLVAGAVFFPVGIVHGVVVWFTGG